MKLPNRTIDVITGELHVVLKRDTANILTIGGLLAEAKGKMQHGEWLPWLKKELSMSERSAQKYVKAADFAAKYELSADLSLSPSVLFLISRYDQREIAEAVIKAARDKHLGYDHAKEIIDKTLAELEVANVAKSEEGSTRGAPQHAKERRGVNPSDYLLCRFTAAVCGLQGITGKNKAERFAKCSVEANILADLGQFLTEISSLKAKHAPLETNPDPEA